jgi:hypothetical protein
MGGRKCGRPLIRLLRLLVCWFLIHLNVLPAMPRLLVFQIGRCRGCRTALAPKFKPRMNHAKEGGHEE